MDELVKRIRGLSRVSNVNGQYVIPLDHPDLGDDEEFKSASLEVVLAYFLSRVDTSNLGIYMLKPVLDVVSTLPASGMVLGDRYFIVDTNSNNHLKILEWNGTAWDIQVTSPGIVIYCYNLNSFIIRDAHSYVLSDSSRRTLEVPFQDATSIKISHNLNKYPTIMAIDSSGRELIIQVIHLSRNSVEVSWTGETSGKIVCN